MGAGLRDRCVPSGVLGNVYERRTMGLHGLPHATPGRRYSSRRCRVRVPPRLAGCDGDQEVGRPPWDQSRPLGLSVRNRSAGRVQLGIARRCSTEPESLPYKSLRAVAAGHETVPNVFLNRASQVRILPGAPVFLQVSGLRRPLRANVNNASDPTWTPSASNARPNRGFLRLARSVAARPSGWHTRWRKTRVCYANSTTYLPRSRGSRAVRGVPEVAIIGPLPQACEGSGRASGSPVNWQAVA